MNIEQLSRSMLFRGMSEKEIGEALSSLGYYEKEFEKGEIIMFSGNTTDKMGFVESGSVTIESNDVWGNRTILSIVPENQFFAETYAYLRDEVMLVDVRANERCRILFVGIGSLNDLSLNPGTFAQLRVLQNNLLRISTNKNLHLSTRNIHTSPKSARERILSYLNTVSVQSGRHEFNIPYDRQQMADYLNLDRSALSKELGKMKKDGLIDFRKNHFILFEQQ